ncbi:hypothetical protein AB84_4753 [Escherichia coli 2-052-05_S3_C1]|nr:hypothetical protein AB84_4753 [Escherichia coli 2-052-05_S3_C1]KDV76548.1 hypothetical protein AC42_4886 [Escherichia coli 2-052-05_S3_C3]KEN80890.1 hypothetical protein AC14_4993 [Escherichia coli 2-052-05_S3_C2]
MLKKVKQRIFLLHQKYDYQQRGGIECKQQSKKDVNYHDIWLLDI